MEHEIALRIARFIANPLAWMILAASPFVGSFLGLLAWRIPQSRGVIFGRSECDECHHPLGAADLLPFASWIWLRGRCRYCGHSIGYFPLVMEFAALGIAAWAVTETSVWILAASCLLGWWLLLLAAIDWRTFLLPDVLTLPLAVTGLAVSYAIDPASLAGHLIGAVAGFAVFAAIALGYSRLRGREGLGLGDAKLMGALGAWISWQGLPAALLFASIAGLIFVLLRSAGRHKFSPGDPIPFGVFLALGGWLVWLYGPLILQAA
jgi:leader peptidase (prepilin peptidase)/N-methyltransferase